MSVFAPVGRLREERGLALIETAVVILLLLFITFAMMEFGWLFHRIQQVNNGAREGVRIAVLPDKTPADAMAAVNSLMTQFRITGATITISPADTSVLNAGDLVTVNVSVPVRNVMLTGLFLDSGFLGNNLRTSATMARESP
jgi:Flp pilus assembly protein TadG